MRMIETPSRLKPPRRSSQSPATSPVDVTRIASAGMKGTAIADLDQLDLHAHLRE